MHVKKTVYIVVNYDMPTGIDEEKKVEKNTKLLSI